MIDWRLFTAVCALALIGNVLASEPVSAASGCCLQRQDANSPWVELGRDIAECERLNAAENDDLFADTGNVWWSLDC